MSTSFSESGRSSQEHQFASDTLHRSSARLLRMSSQDASASKSRGTGSGARSDKSMQHQDFHDLFATLVVSLPLTTHRHLFQKYTSSFTSDEALANLGSLKFSQSNRMPDPKDSTRIVTTTTTTTFSMARETARSVCQRFLDARLIQPAIDGKDSFSSKSAIWLLTPKGTSILRAFCNRNGIVQEHVTALTDAPKTPMQLLLLERELESDKLHTEAGITEVIFRRFAGCEPNCAVLATDAEGLPIYPSSTMGVKVQKERKVGDRLYFNVFAGIEVINWLLSCTTVVDRRESMEIAAAFLKYGLLQLCGSSDGSAGELLAVKNQFYIITEKGQRLAGWIPPSGGVKEAAAAKGREGVANESSTNKLAQIIGDPALRLLFTEFLRDTLCSENLSFYLDCDKFLVKCNEVKGGPNEGDHQVPQGVGDAIANAFHLYNTFLALGSPNELNIDYNLRSDLAKTMTLQFSTERTDQTDAGLVYLEEISVLFGQAKTSVFKLMASDSVPKFVREKKYAHVLQSRNLAM